jgi:hypothetical protein
VEDWTGNPQAASSGGLSTKLIARTLGISRNTVTSPPPLRLLLRPRGTRSGLVAGIVPIPVIQPPNAHDGVDRLAKCRHDPNRRERAGDAGIKSCGENAAAQDHDARNKHRPRVITTRQPVSTHGSLLHELLCQGIWPVRAGGKVANPSSSW